MRKKNILIITYHYPPSTAVGGLRWAKFSDHLYKMGYNIKILTIYEKYLSGIDKTRMERKENAAVSRTNKYSTFLDFYESVKKSLSTSGTKSTSKKEDAGYSFVPINQIARAKESVRQKIKRFVLSLLLFPDLMRGWILPAVFAGRRIIKAGDVNIMITSGPPHSAHIVGLLLKKLTGIPWVSDFRDPWIAFGVKQPSLASAISIKIERWLESATFKRADLVLLTTDLLRKKLSDHFDKLPGGKFICLTNGYNRDHIAKVPSNGKFPQFTISYTGTLYAGRSPEPLFRAVSELIQEGRVSHDQIMINLVGDCSNPDNTPIGTMINLHKLESVVKVYGQLPLLEALDIIRKSHIALLIQRGFPLQIPAKVYDYFGLGVKILAITEEGATGELVNSTGTGAAFEPSDIQSIKSFIVDSLVNADSNWAVDPDVLKRFDSFEIAKELDRQLSSML